MPFIDVWNVCMYVPARAGPMAIPILKRRAPIPVDIPMNSFGAEDTIKFHVVVVVSANPIAIIVRFADTRNPVE